MKQIILFFTFFLSLIFFQSCEKTTYEFQEPRGNYEHGFFIVNEGPFGNGNGSLSFVDSNFETTEPNVYENVNGETLGNIVQSMIMYEDKAFIVVNNSNRILITNRYTMEKEAVIENGLNNPRYVVLFNGKAYVSNWGSPFDPTDDYIAVIDLATYEVTQNIAIGEGPETMSIVGNSLYVALKGGWDFNNKISVIDLNNNTVQTNIEVGYIPNSMYVKDTALYVLCAGIPSWSWTLPESGGKLLTIDTNTQTIIESKDFTTTQHPNFLSFDNENFYYYLGNQVYRWNETNTSPDTLISGLDGFYYGMTAKNGILYTLDAGDFTSEGTLNVYYLQNNSLIKSISTGIIPNSVVFN